MLHSAETSRHPNGSVPTATAGTAPVDLSAVVESAVASLQALQLLMADTPPTCGPWTLHLGMPL